MIKIYIYIITVLAFMLPCNIHAQKPTYVPGQLILQTDGTPLSQIINGANPGTRALAQMPMNTRKLSPELGLHLIEFDDQKVAVEDLLDNLKSHPQVLAVQRNHYLQNRRTPDDPKFEAQWPLRSNSTLNADIQIEAAWDITTGGKLANTHDIVIAVIDDGFQVDHPDLIENIYVNIHEIPGNGIDDDDNGYVDDYMGWNFETNNDSLNVGDHGEPVAGVIGARGNNGIGVAGINWDVKILPLLLDSRFTDAGLLASYIYAYNLRKKFNDTQGLEGAFVAVTNSSWGAERYFPDEFPVWCNFYDSLSSVGILNCVATSNNNINVDVVGDIPSLCPSESMIVMTNTNMKRELVGAHGPQNVDMAAPGEQIYTLKGMGYGYESGTSFSTPVASGILGLMYSVPVPGILEAVLAEPEQTALLFKQILMDSYDHVPALEGKIKYPGIVNARKAVEGILSYFSVDEIEYCLIDSLDDSGIYLDTLILGNEIVATGDNHGYKPQSFLVDTLEQGRYVPISFVSNTTTDSVDFALWIDINRDSVFSPQEVLVQKRGKGRWDGLFFMPETVDSGYYNIRVAAMAPTDSINPCAVNIPEYEYEDYTVYVKLNPLLCQLPPVVDTMMSGPNYLQIVWTDVDSSVAYVFRYRKQGDAEWEDEMVDTAKMFTLEELDACTPYEFQVRSVCFYDTSSYSPIAVFITQCPTSSEEHQFSEQISLYPNPSPTGDLTIDFGSTLANLPTSEARVSLYSMEGRLIRQTTLPGLAEQVLRLSWPGLPRGMYTVKIDVGDRFAVKKWVVP